MVNLIVKTDWLAILLVGWSESAEFTRPMVWVEERRRRTEALSSDPRNQRRRNLVTPQLQNRIEEINKVPKLVFVLPSS